MYHSKEQKKPHVVFAPAMFARAISLHELETDLRIAVERNEFEVYYQPIVNIDDARLEGFEALVRWNHPKRGLVMPNDFIPVSESTGLIIPMTRNILSQACQQIVRWQKEGNGNEQLFISVNISATHFSDARMVEHIASILRSTGIPPDCLKLEITEGEVMENAEEAISKLEEIRALGIRISIDDFGTGYSSLSYLHKLPIDTLKIDRSFVGTMEEGSDNGEIVRTIIALANALKLSVVAEGIESIHQFHQLRVLGCQYGQGYLFARPMNAKDAEKITRDPDHWKNILPISGFGVVDQNLEYTLVGLPN
jgi:EAL domain-containing protein (putative c-di-GMP-specific phosphodiesterase class I)